MDAIVVADVNADAAFYVILGIAVAIVVMSVLLFRAMWKVPEPNQALLVSGRHHREEGGTDWGFRVVVGHAGLVIPGLQVVRRLNLDLKEAELQADWGAETGIRGGVRG